MDISSTGSSLSSAGSNGYSAPDYLSRLNMQQPTWPLAAPKPENVSTPVTSRRYTSRSQNDVENMEVDTHGLQVVIDIDGRI